MDTSDLNIRLAGPKDIEQLTALHCASFRPEDHVPMQLGRNYVKAYYRWSVGNKNSYVLVAEFCGKIVGLVATCDMSFTNSMFIACLPEFFLSLLAHPSLIFNQMLWKRLLRQPEEKANQYKRIISHPKVAQMMIGAVDSYWRGKSLFPLLISLTKDYSKKRGSRAIRAGVYKTNAPSIRAFIKEGWIETPDLETDDTIFFMAFLDDSIANELGLEGLLR